MSADGNINPSTEADTDRPDGGSEAVINTSNAESDNDQDQPQTRNEDQQVPGGPSVKCVVFCALLSAIGGMILGYNQGINAVTLVLPQFLEQFPEVPRETTVYKGLLPTIVIFGALFGAMNQGWIADKISRRKSIVWAVGIFMAGSAIQTASLNHKMLISGRVFGGLGIGMLSMVAPLYISEISPPKIRGLLLVLQEFSIVVGIISSTSITYGTKNKPGNPSWQIPFGLQLIPGLVLGLGAFFIPYSPRWLAAKGRDEEALEALARLNKLPEDDPDVRKEWLEILVEVAFQKEVLENRSSDVVAPRTTWEKLELKLRICPWTNLFRSACRKRTWVAFGLMFLQQFAGTNALIYYAPTFFENLGVDNRMQLLLPTFLQLTQLGGVATSLWTVDHFGRKPVLLVGSSGMLISHIVIAILIRKNSANWPSHSKASVAGVVFLFAYMFLFGASWGPIPWAMPAEIFPSPLRAKGVAFSTFSHWLCNLAIGFLTPLLIQKTGYGVHVFFAVWCLLSIPWTTVFVKETRGETLETMDELFQDRGTATCVEMKNQIRNRIQAKFGQGYELDDLTNPVD
ncbi:related to transporter (major facilitator superfamily) [Rhynchosporium secalis]|uniref:Related to transporter (Major facilitator superfamily) n=1 Tax=Rhynchosporium secalis TaxID=38038 RepID=A0A1E1M874_RHYSE|nr:related to transporter (major facilitator superfamily) [Rhynchosporium secalis]